MNIFGYVHYFNLLFISSTIHSSIAINEYITDNINYWNSTSSFTPIQNTSYGTIQLKTALYMQLNIIFHGKTLNNRWENVFRIGHAGYLQNDHKCSKNDRFPALWIDEANNAFVFDLSDQTNCFRQYTNYQIQPEIQYSIIINYNSSWVSIKINDNITLSQPRMDKTSPSKLNTDVGIWISTAQAIPANVTMSDISILSYDDNSIPSPPSLSPTVYPTYPTNLPSIYPTKTPTHSPTPDPTVKPTTNPSFSPSHSPTLYPTLRPTQSKLPSLFTTKRPTKKPTTFLPTAERLYTTTTSTSTTTIPTTTVSAMQSSTELLEDMLEATNINTDDMDEKNISFPLTTTTTTNTSNMSTDIMNIYSIDDNDNNNNNNKGLSFEVIFYILTGCAMGGILFCICTCCCFGCIINKKIKSLADDDDDIEREYKHKSHPSRMSISNMIFYRGNESEIRIQTMSEHNKSSFDSSSPPHPDDGQTLTISPRSDHLSTPLSHVTSPPSHDTAQWPSSPSSIAGLEVYHDPDPHSLPNNYNKKRASHPSSETVIVKTEPFHRDIFKHKAPRKSKKRRLRNNKSVPIMAANTNIDRKIKIQREWKRNKSSKRGNMEYVDNGDTTEDSEQEVIDEKEEEEEEEEDDNEEDEELKQDGEDTMDLTQSQAHRHSIISPLGGKIPKIPGYDDYLERQLFYENRKIDGKMNANDMNENGNESVLDREESKLSYKSYTNTISIQTHPNHQNQKHFAMPPNALKRNATVFSDPSTQNSLFVHKSSSGSNHHHHHHQQEMVHLVQHHNSLNETDEEETSSTTSTGSTASDSESSSSSSSDSVSSNVSTQLISKSIATTTEESRKNKHDRDKTKQYQIQIEFAKKRLSAAAKKSGYVHHHINTKSGATPNGEDELIADIIQFENEYYDHDIKHVQDEIDSLDSSSNDEEDEDMKQQQATSSNQDESEDVGIVTIGDGGSHETKTRSVDDAIKEIEPEEEDDDDQKDGNNKSSPKSQQPTTVTHVAAAKTFLSLPDHNSAATEISNSSSSSSKSMVSSSTSSSTSSSSSSCSSSSSSASSSSGSASSSSSSSSSASSITLSTTLISTSTNGLRSAFQSEVNRRIKNQNNKIGIIGGRDSNKLDIRSNQSATTGSSEYYSNSPQSEF